MARRMSKEKRKEKDKKNETFQRFVKEHIYFIRMSQNLTLVQRDV